MNRWSFKPWKKVTFPLENSCMDIYNMPGPSCQSLSNYFILSLICRSKTASNARGPHLAPQRNVLRRRQPDDAGSTAYVWLPRLQQRACCVQMHQHLHQEMRGRAGMARRRRGGDEPGWRGGGGSGYGAKTSWDDAAEADQDTHYG